MKVDGVNVALFSLSAAILVAGLAADARHPTTCTKPVVVKSILSVEGRDATILLTDGTTLIVNQATLKPGDTTCAKWERRP